MEVTLHVTYTEAWINEECVRCWIGRLRAVIADVQMLYFSDVPWIRHTLTKRQNGSLRRNAG